MTNKKENTKLSMIEAAKLLGEKSNLSEENIIEMLSDSFIKAFEKEIAYDLDRNPDFLKYDPQEPVNLSRIEPKIDLKNSIIEINRIWTVTDDLKIEDRFTHISVDDPLIKDMNLKPGDLYSEELKLEDVSYGKAQHIKVLLLQKLKEFEKERLYEEFKSKKDQLITAKVFKYEPNKFAILEYDGASVFMPAREFLPNETFKLGQNILVYILEIEKETSGAQIIASRANENFVKKLIEKEIDDVQDGVVEIVNIAREPGHKTKIVVRSSSSEVDPIGSIIGVKGSKIAPIISELKGERIDVIKWSSDPVDLIKEAILPARIIGIHFEKTEDSSLATIIVEDDQFLPAIGKRGINVMLVAKLSYHKIDVKTKTDAEKDGFEYTPVTYENSKHNYSYNNQNDKEKQNFELDELTLDELAEMGSEIEDNESIYMTKNEED